MLKSYSIDDNLTASILPSSSLPGSTQPTPITNSTNVERDDWWYDGTDNLFLNRSGEHRMECSHPN